MREKDSISSITRREMLRRAAAACVAGMRPLEASEFWDKKQPSEWSVEEIEKLKTKSPWAKEVSAQVSGGGGGGGGGTGGGRMGGGMGVPGIGMGGRRGGMGGGRRRMAQQLKGTVRWESAQPIVDATRTPFPAAFANFYVVSVNGFPLNQRRRSQSDDSDGGTAQSKLDNLKMYTSLQPKGKSLAQAGIVQMVPEGSGNLWFGFAKDVLNLSADDKEVEFTTQLGRLHLKTKFELKSMKYHGKLAV